MTQEEKQLLIKELCEMLPYGVKIHIESKFLEEKGWSVQRLLGMEVFLPLVIAEHNSYKIEKCKPYLRPISSMTEVERTEMNLIIYSARVTGEYFRITEYYNKNHLDYYDLIGRNLAIEAPEGMYSIENTKSEQEQIEELAELKRKLSE